MNMLANFYCSDFTHCGSNLDFYNNVTVICHFTRIFSYGDALLYRDK